MKIVIGADKSGFYLKEAIKGHLVAKGYDVEDVGTQNVEVAMPFYDVAPILAKKIQANEYDKGILICGTGMGMSLVANKYKGVFASCVESLYSAKKCRAINNANVMTMGGWIINDMMGIEMVDAFLNTEFTEGLEEWRQEFLHKAQAKISDIEDSIYS
jgi:ribose 5-phosphate isomerase B